LVGYIKIKMPIVYITTNIFNGKKYIGVDSKNNPDYLGSGKYLNRAITKYGRDNFIKEILFESEDIDQVYLKEKEIIQSLSADISDEYYNIHEGGKGGWKNIKCDGENNGMHGRSVRDIFIKKYGDVLGNEKYNQTRRIAGIKTSASLKGVTKSKEHCEKLSLSKKEYFKNETPEQKKFRCETTRLAMKNANIVRDDEYKKKMKESIKNAVHLINKKFACEHCGIITNRGNLKRWHNNNCKQR